MDSLQTLIDRWHDMVINGALDDGIVEARHALELRLAELTGTLRGAAPYAAAADQALTLVQGSDRQ